MKKGVVIIFLPLIFALMTVYIVFKIVGAASDAVAKVAADMLDAFSKRISDVLDEDENGKERATNS